MYASKIRNARTLDTPCSMLRRGLFSHRARYILQTVWPLLDEHIVRALNPARWVHVPCNANLGNKGIVLR
jgi:hypothetical protein